MDAPTSKWIAPKRLVDTLFEVDQIMPEQYRAQFSGQGLSPAARLYREVVQSCLHDLAVYAPGHSYHDQALRWLLGLDRAAITFTTAVECGYMGLDPDVVREGLLKRVRDGAFNRQEYVASRAANREGSGTKVQRWQCA